MNKIRALNSLCFWAIKWMILLLKSGSIVLLWLNLTEAGIASVSVLLCCVVHDWGSSGNVMQQASMITIITCHTAEARPGFGQAESCLPVVSFWYCSVHFWRISGIWLLPVPLVPGIATALLASSLQWALPESHIAIGLPVCLFARIVDRVDSHCHNWILTTHKFSLGTVFDCRI